MAPPGLARRRPRAPLHPALPPYSLVWGTRGDCAPDRALPQVEVRAGQSFGLSPCILQARDHPHAPPPKIDPIHRLPPPHTYGRHITQKPDVSHSVLRKFRSSKAEEATEADDDDGYDGPGGPPAAIAWAEGNQLAAAGAAAADAPTAPVAFPALAGVPATVALAQDVEQVALQAMEWRAAAAAAGEDAGGSVPEIFRRPPPPPLRPALPSTPDQPSQNGGRGPADGGGSGGGGSGGDGDGGGVASTVSGGGVGTGMGMDMDGGGPPVQLQGYAVAPDVFSHFSAAPEPLLASPPLSSSICLDPQGRGSPVPVFGVGAEQLQQALFGDEDDQGDGIVHEEGQGTGEGEGGGAEVGGGQGQGGAVGFDPTATGVPPHPPRPS